MKHVLIVSYHFYPGTAVGAKRPSELAIRLAAEGYTVSVIAARTEGDNQLVKRLEDINVTYIPVPPDILKKIAHTINKIRYGSIHKNNKLKNESGKTENSLEHPEPVFRRFKRLILSVLAITEGLGLWCLMVLGVIIRIRLKNKPDLIITSGPPMVVHHTGYITRKLFKTKWIMDLRDPLPVLLFIYQLYHFIKPEIRSELRKKIELLQEKKWLTGSDLITVASPGIRDEILTRYPTLNKKIHVIYNGYDNLNTGSGRTSGKEKMTFLYAGSLYYNRNPFPLLEGLKSLAEEKLIEPDRIEFLFYGNCESWKDQSLTAWIEENHMQDFIKIHPPVTSEEINRIMCEADVLINFCQGQRLQIPAKTFDYLGTGKISLVITEQNSATAALIRESGGGIIIDPDKDDIKDILLEMYNSYGQSDKNKDNDVDKIKRYSRQFQNTRYLELIHELGI